MYTTTAVRYVHGAPKIWNACVPLLPHFHAASTGMCSLPGKSAQVIFGATAKLFTMWIHAFLRQHKCRQPPLTSRPSLATFFSYAQLVAPGRAQEARDWREGERASTYRGD
ncbi:unnamed protein product, partial [Ectocarpus sp. 13 AM-2016]